VRGSRSLRGPNTRLPIIDDPSAGLVTYKQAKRIANKRAREASTKDPRKRYSAVGITWHGCAVAGPFEDVIMGRAPRYWRISLGADPVKRRGAA